MRLVALGALVALSLVSTSAIAQPKYGPGTSATEIKVGQTIAYSGPASAYSQLAKAEAAYFKWLNAKGGINGRKINFISLDDGYSPPKAVENARKLVESDQVALVFNVLGTPLNMAIRPYLNQKKVPQLFIAAGATDFNDPAALSLDDGLAAQPAGRGGLLRPAPAEEQTQRQDRGALPERRFRQGPAATASTMALGDKAKTMIVDTQNFQATDPTIDSQLITLKNSGADTLFLFTYAKQAAQAITKLDDLNWKPRTYLHLGAASVGATFKPAGLDKSKGILSAGFLKDVTDPKWANDDDVKDMDRLDEGQPAGRRAQRQPERGGLHVRQDARAGAEAVRRRSDAREHHEAGGEPEGLPPAACCCRAARSTPARPTIASSST